MQLGRSALIFVALLPPTIAAQITPASKAKEATGGVTGHVLCADTNLPARLASVYLQPVYETIPPPPKSGEDPPQTSAAVKISETMLDGSYSITGVKPGRYYVVVEKAGYLSPLQQLTREKLNKPDDAASALIAKLLVPVTVTANHLATADVRILRGGSISGTVRFDDGSPYGQADIALLRKSSDGKWNPYRTMALGTIGEAKTDDLGRFRLSGLPEGEYLVKVTVNVTEILTDNVFGLAYGSSSSSNGFSLSIYYGGALRTRDAKVLKLAESEEADQVDFEVPVSRLHTVSGSVLDTSGHAVNAGKVAIFYLDDNTEMTSSDVDKSDGEFHLYFVPEGKYTLKVTGAKDVTREEIPNPPGSMPPSHTEEKMIREYLDGQQPILIEGDMMGVIALVKTKDLKQAAAQ